MGCGGSSEEAAKPAAAPQQQARSAPGGRPIIQPPNPNDPPFMQTASPGGMSWGEYVRTGSSFVDPRTGFLAGPWAECVAWAVVFEHNNDWSSMPQYAADGVVGGVLSALERTNAGPQVMEAAQRLEDASHQLAENGQPLPAINQCINLPPNAVPGQPCQIMNPQAPGTYMTVQVPPNAQPGQQILAPAPVQPTKTGTSTGTKLAYAAGGAVVAGGVAGAIYYGTSGGGVDGFVGDMQGAGGAIQGAVGGIDAGGMAGDAQQWAGGAADQVGGAVSGFDAGGFAQDAGQWGEGAVADVGSFGADAMDGVLNLF
eukprot:TRINITY_DN6285_c0_g1_i1.p1 TRINITY_DN6285_c0_g1~~TRINITY_DN6285_c0_g1_i1.p1  ORF type:complete len:313 (-),score=70.97 TRINITY_DN6285_c0_g1_i1:333-1271(-)